MKLVALQVFTQALWPQIRGQFASWFEHQLAASEADTSLGLKAAVAEGGMVWEFEEVMVFDEKPSQGRDSL